MKTKSHAPSAVRTAALAGRTLTSPKPHPLAAQANPWLQQPIKMWLPLAEKAAYQVKTLAVLCKLTTRRLDRFFQHRFHTTPHAWLLTQRMKEALHWLRRDRPIKQVAKLAHYSDPSHFCRAFKQAMGFTPAKGRRRGPIKHS